MVVTFGRDARARLAAIASGKAAPPAKSASFTEAEAGAKGRDAFYYFDLAPVLGLVGTLGASPRAGGDLRTAGSRADPPRLHRGWRRRGQELDDGFRPLPLAAFTSIGALVTAGAMKS